MRRALLVPVLALSLAVAPALAQDDTPPMPEDGGASELARQAVEDLMGALGLMLRAIPQYEMPYVNERGDIIIRRKNPPAERAPEGGDADIDETKT